MSFTQDLLDIFGSSEADTAQPDNSTTVASQLNLSDETVILADVGEGFVKPTDGVALASATLPIENDLLDIAVPGNQIVTTTYVSNSEPLFTFADEKISSKPETVDSAIKASSIDGDVSGAFSFAEPIHNKTNITSVDLLGGITLSTDNGKRVDNISGTVDLLALGDGGSEMDSSLLGDVLQHQISEVVAEPLSNTESNLLDLTPALSKAEKSAPDCPDGGLLPSIVEETSSESKAHTDFLDLLSPQPLLDLVNPAQQQSIFDESSTVKPVTDTKNSKKTISDNLVMDVQKDSSVTNNLKSQFDRMVDNSAIDEKQDSKKELSDMDAGKNILSPTNTRLDDMERNLSDESSQQTGYKVAGLVKSEDSSFPSDPASAEDDESGNNLLNLLEPLNTGNSYESTPLDSSDLTANALDGLGTEIGHESHTSDLHEVSTSWNVNLESNDPQMLVETPVHLGFAFDNKFSTKNVSDSVIAPVKEDSKLSQNLSDMASDTTVRSKSSTSKNTDIKSHHKKDKAIQNENFPSIEILEIEMRKKTEEIIMSSNGHECMQSSKEISGNSATTDVLGMNFESTYVDYLVEGNIEPVANPSESDSDTVKNEPQDAPQNDGSVDLQNVSIDSTQKREISSFDNPLSEIVSVDRKTQSEASMMYEHNDKVLGDMLSSTGISDELIITSIPGPLVINQSEREQKLEGTLPIENEWSSYQVAEYCVTSSKGTLESSSHINNEDDNLPLESGKSQPKHVIISDESSFNRNLSTIMTESTANDLLSVEVGKLMQKVYTGAARELGLSSDENITVVLEEVPRTLGNEESYAQKEKNLFNMLSRDCETMDELKKSDYEISSTDGITVAGQDNKISLENADLEKCNQGNYEKTTGLVQDMENERCNSSTTSNQKVDTLVTTTMYESKHVIGSDENSLLTYEGRLAIDKAKEPMSSAVSCANGLQGFILPVATPVNKVSSIEDVQTIGGNAVISNNNESHPCLHIAEGEDSLNKDTLENFIECDYSDLKNSSLKKDTNVNCQNVISHHLNSNEKEASSVANMLDFDENDESLHKSTLSSVCNDDQGKGETKTTKEKDVLELDHEELVLVTVNPDTQTEHMNGESRIEMETNAEGITELLKTDIPIGLPLLENREPCISDFSSGSSACESLDEGEYNLNNDVLESSFTKELVGRFVDGIVYDALFVVSEDPEYNEGPIVQDKTLNQNLSSHSLSRHDEFSLEQDSVIESKETTSDDSIEPGELQVDMPPPLPPKRKKKILLEEENHGHGDQPSSELDGECKNSSDIVLLNNNHILEPNSAISFTIEESNDTTKVVVNSNSADKAEKVQVLYSLLSDENDPKHDESLAENIGINSDDWLLGVKDHKDNQTTNDKGVSMTGESPAQISTLQCIENQDTSHISHRDMLTEEVPTLLESPNFEPTSLEKENDSIAQMTASDFPEFPADQMKKDENKSDTKSAHTQSADEIISDSVEVATPIAASCEVAITDQGITKANDEVKDALKSDCSTSDLLLSDLNPLVKSDMTIISHNVNETSTQMNLINGELLMTERKNGENQKSVSPTQNTPALIMDESKPDEKQVDVSNSSISNDANALFRDTGEEFQNDDNLHKQCLDSNSNDCLSKINEDSHVEHRDNAASGTNSDERKNTECDRNPITTMKTGTIELERQYDIVEDDNDEEDSVDNEPSDKNQVMDLDDEVFLSKIDGGRVVDISTSAHEQVTQGIVGSQSATRALSPRSITNIEITANKSPVFQQLTPPPLPEPDYEDLDDSELQYVKSHSADDIESLRYDDDAFYSLAVSASTSFMKKSATVPPSCYSRYSATVPSTVFIDDDSMSDNDSDDASIQSSSSDEDIESNQFSDPDAYDDPILQYMRSVGGKRLFPQVVYQEDQTAPVSSPTYQAYDTDWEDVPTEPLRRYSALPVILEESEPSEAEESESENIPKSFVQIAVDISNEPEKQAGNGMDRELAGSETSKNGPNEPKLSSEVKKNVPAIIITDESDDTTSTIETEHQKSTMCLNEQAKEIQDERPTNATIESPNPVKLDSDTSQATANEDASFNQPTPDDNKLNDLPTKNFMPANNSSESELCLDKDNLHKQDILDNAQSIFEQTEDVPPPPPSRKKKNTKQLQSNDSNIFEEIQPSHSSENSQETLVKESNPSLVIVDDHSNMQKPDMGSVKDKQSLVEMPDQTVISQQSSESFIGVPKCVDILQVSDSNQASSDQLINCTEIAVEQETSEETPFDHETNPQPIEKLISSDDLSANELHKNRPDLRNQNNERLPSEPMDNLPPPRPSRKKKNVGQTQNDNPDILEDKLDIKSKETAIQESDQSLSIHDNHPHLEELGLILPLEDKLPVHDQQSMVAIPDQAVILPLSSESPIGVLTDEAALQINDDKQESVMVDQNIICVEVDANQETHEAISVGQTKLNPQSAEKLMSSTDMSVNKFLAGTPDLQTGKNLNTCESVIPEPSEDSPPPPPSRKKKSVKQLEKDNSNVHKETETNRFNAKSEKILLESSASPVIVSNQPQLEETLIAPPFEDKQSVYDQSLVELPDQSMISLQSAEMTVGVSKLPEPLKANDNKQVSSVIDQQILGNETLDKMKTQDESILQDEPNIISEIKNNNGQATDIPAEAIEKDHSYFESSTSLDNNVLIQSTEAPGITTLAEEPHNRSDIASDLVVISFNDIKSAIPFEEEELQKPFDQASKDVSQYEKPEKMDTTVEVSKEGIEVIVPGIASHIQQDVNVMEHTEMTENIAVLVDDSMADSHSETCSEIQDDKSVDVISLDQGNKDIKVEEVQEIELITTQTKLDNIPGNTTLFEDKQSDDSTTPQHQEDEAISMVPLALSQPNPKMEGDINSNIDLNQQTGAKDISDHSPSEHKMENDIPRLAIVDQNAAVVHLAENLPEFTEQPGISSTIQSSVASVQEPLDECTNVRLLGYSNISKESTVKQNTTSSNLPETVFTSTEEHDVSLSTSSLDVDTQVALVEESKTDINEKNQVDTERDDISREAISVQHTEVDRTPEVKDASSDLIEKNQVNAERDGVIGETISGQCTEVDHPVENGSALTKEHAGTSITHLKVSPQEPMGDAVTVESLKQNLEDVQIKCDVLTGDITNQHIEKIPISEDLLGSNEHPQTLTQELRNDAISMVALEQSLPNDKVHDLSDNFMAFKEDQSIQSINQSPKASAQNETMANVVQVDHSQSVAEMGSNVSLEIVSDNYINVEDISEIVSTSAQEDSALSAEPLEPNAQVRSDETITERSLESSALHSKTEGDKQLEVVTNQTTDTGILSENISTVTKPNDPQAVGSIQNQSQPNGLSSEMPCQSKDCHFAENTLGFSNEEFTSQAGMVSLSNETAPVKNEQGIYLDSVTEEGLVNTVLLDDTKSDVLVTEKLKESEFQLNATQTETQGAAENHQLPILQIPNIENEQSECDQSPSKLQDQMESDITQGTSDVPIVNAAVTSPSLLLDELEGEHTSLTLNSVSKEEKSDTARPMLPDQPNDLPPLPPSRKKKKVKQSVNSTSEADADTQTKTSSLNSEEAQIQEATLLTGIASSSIEHLIGDKQLCDLQNETEHSSEQCSIIHDGEGDKYLQEQHSLICKKEIDEPKRETLSATAGLSALNQADENAKDIASTPPEDEVLNAVENRIIGTVRTDPMKLNFSKSVSENEIGFPNKSTEKTVSSAIISSDLQEFSNFHDPDSHFVSELTTDIEQELTSVVQKGDDGKLEKSTERMEPLSTVEKSAITILPMVIITDENDVEQPNPITSPVESWNSGQKRTYFSDQDNLTDASLSDDDSLSNIKIEDNEENEFTDADQISTPECDVIVYKQIADTLIAKVMEEVMSRVENKFLPSSDQILESDDDSVSEETMMMPTFNIQPDITGVATIEKFNDELQQKDSPVEEKPEDASRSLPHIEALKTEDEDARFLKPSRRHHDTSGSIGSIIYLTDSEDEDSKRTNVLGSNPLISLENDPFVDDSEPFAISSSVPDETNVSGRKKSLVPPSSLVLSVALGDVALREDDKLPDILETPVSQRLSLSSSLTSSQTSLASSNDDSIGNKRSALPRLPSLRSKKPAVQSPPQIIRTRIQSADPGDIIPIVAMPKLRRVVKWENVTVKNIEYKIDETAVQPYKKVIAHGGFYDEKSAIIEIFIPYLPNSNIEHYPWIMDNLFLYVLATVELLAQDKFSVVIFVGSKNQLPANSLLKRWHEHIDYRLKKNVEAFYIVNSTFYFRTMARLFISRKVSRKMKYVKNLAELRNHIPTDFLFVPPEISK